MRNSLRYALNKGVIDKAIEIGVREGKNALDLLVKGKVKNLHLVDPYMPFKTGGFNKKTKIYQPDVFWVSKEKQDGFKKEMFERLAPFGDRIYLYTTTSLKASILFSDNYFDYIYIDGDHTYEAVKTDLELWYPKVKKGGVFAGHDFTKPHLGVDRAVKEFAKKYNYNVMIAKPDENTRERWANFNDRSDWWIDV